MFVILGGRGEKERVFPPSGLIIAGRCLFVVGSEGLSGFENDGCRLVLTFIVL